MADRGEFDDLFALYNEKWRCLECEFHKTRADSWKQSWEESNKAHQRTLKVALTFSLGLLALSIWRMFL